jgi:hypothetical protein
MIHCFISVIFSGIEERTNFPSLTVALDFTSERILYTTSRMVKGLLRGVVVLRAKMLEDNTHSRPHKNYSY